MIPLPVSTHPVAAIQQRSTVQERMPPRKLEGENPNGFRSRTASKPGSNCGATGIRGGRVAQGPWGQVFLRPHPCPSLYRWPGGPLGAIGGGGVPLGLLLPKGDLPTGESESKEESSHMWRPHHPNFGQPPWGALPPKAKGFGAHMVLSGNLWNLPEASMTFQDPSGPFSAIPGWFRDISEPSGTLPRPSGTVFGRSGTIWIGSGTIRVMV